MIIDLITGFLQAFGAFFILWLLTQLAVFIYGAAKHLVYKNTCYYNKLIEHDKWIKENNEKIDLMWKKYGNNQNLR
jgi:hypothetical protein